MHCEFCDIYLHDTSAARRHMLSIAHIRNRRNYDLNKVKYVEKRRQATIHPKNFEELASLLNMHSSQDVQALYENDFFKMKDQWHFSVAEELIRILQDSGLEYDSSRLNAEVKLALIKAIERERTDQTEDPGNVSR